MQWWNLLEIEAPGGTTDPAVLTTDDGARAIAIRLDAGQEMDDHQVRERAWVLVVEGRAQIRCGDEQVDGGVGTLVTCYVVMGLTDTMIAFEMNTMLYVVLVAALLHFCRDGEREATS